MKLDNILKKIISFTFTALFILIPLFFTSVNSELFEFNKIILVYGFTVLIAGVWSTRMILHRKILFKRTFLDIPLVLFLASQFTSALLSIDPHTSIFGYYSRFNGGLLSTISYLLLYWALVSNCEAKDVLKFIKVSLITGAIISVYGILEHFGHSFSCLIFQGNFSVGCWVQKVQERVFATLGQPNWLAAYLVVLTPLTWWLALISNTQSKFQKEKYLKFNMYVCYLLFAIYYVCLLFTQSRSGFLGFILSYLVFWSIMFFTNRHQVKVILKPFIILNSLFIILIFVFGSPFSQINKYLSLQSIKSSFTPLGSDSFTPPTTNLQSDTQIATGGTESSVIRKIVWKGAIDIFNHYPLFGSGVETFAYSYYNFRPIEHNYVSEWDFLYNKAHNEYLNYLSTTGIFGLGAYLFLIVTFIIWNLIHNETVIARSPSIILGVNSATKQSPLRRDCFGDLRPLAMTYLHTALFTGWLSLLVTNFFGFSVVVTSLYFFLIPAFVVVLASHPEGVTASHLPPPSSLPRRIPSKVEGEGGSPSPLLIIPLIANYLLLIAIVNLWKADFYYNRGLKLTKQSQHQEAFQNYAKAISLSPNEPVFLSEISASAASLAYLTKQENNIADAEKLAEAAISYSNLARRISPLNLNIVKTRIKVLYTLSDIKPENLTEAIKTVEEGIEMAPTDPKLTYHLALLYGKNQQSAQAISTLEKAVTLKENYYDARFALATFYEDLKLKDKAIEQYEYLIKLNPVNKEELEAKIKKLQSQ